MVKPKLIRITTVPISLHKLLSNQLKHMSAHYEVVAVSSGGKLLDKVSNTQGVRTIAIDMTRKITPLKDLLALWKLYRLIHRERPLIVHTHTPKAGLLGMMAAWMAGVPVRLHTVAGMPLLEEKGVKRKVLDFVERMTYAFAVKVYPNSYKMMEIICKNSYCTRSKLKVIGNGSSNGIDVSFFDPGLFDKDAKSVWREKLNIDEKDKVFCFVGRMVRDKGIQELITAFSSLAEKYNNVKLLLVGPFERELSPLNADTEKIIFSHPSIRFMDYQEVVPPYLAISNIFVFPSYREGFPNVVMQAGAMGLPCIVSDINGCNEIIVEGKNGLIIPVKDSEALKKAMLFMLNNEHAMQMMTAVSREMITSRYDQLLLWQHLLKEYEWCIADVQKK